MAHPGKRSNQTRKVAKRQAAQQARAAARRAGRNSERRVSDIDPTGGMTEEQPPAFGTVARIIRRIP